MEMDMWSREMRWKENPLSVDIRWINNEQFFSPLTFDFCKPGRAYKYNMAFVCYFGYFSPI